MAVQLYLNSCFSPSNGCHPGNQKGRKPPHLYLNSLLLFFLFATGGICHYPNSLETFMKSQK